MGRHRRGRPEPPEGRQGRDLRLRATRAGAPNTTVIVGDGAGGLWLGALRRARSAASSRASSAFFPPRRRSAAARCARCTRTRRACGSAPTGGLHLYRGRPLPVLLARDGLPAAPVRAIRRDRTGTLWVGTDGGGVARRTGGRFVVYRERDGLAGDNVRVHPRGPQGPPLDRHLRRALALRGRPLHELWRRGGTDRPPRPVAPRGRGRRLLARHLRRRPVPLRATDASPRSAAATACPATSSTASREDAARETSG